MYCKRIVICDLYHTMSLVKGAENANGEFRNEGGKVQVVQNIVDLLIMDYTSDANWNLITSNPPALHKAISSNPQDFLSRKTETKQVKAVPFEVLNSNIQHQLLTAGSYWCVCKSELIAVWSSLDEGSVPHNGEAWWWKCCHQSLCLWDSG